jgi:glycine/D-amino acid oxidase-like deaminating enzyme
MPKHTALTAKRNLRTGVSYWQSRPMPGVPGTHLTHDIDTDVLVVGAGISGALVAEALAGDYRVVVVDRRGVARGSTPASTALVRYEIDTPLIHLAHKIGADDAARVWRRYKLALDSLGARTRELGIRCDPTERDTLYLAGDVLDGHGLKAEREARRT